MRSKFWVRHRNLLLNDPLDVVPKAVADIFAFVHRILQSPTNPNGLIDLSYDLCHVILVLLDKNVVVVHTGVLNRCKEFDSFRSISFYSFPIRNLPKTRK